MYVKLEMGLTEQMNAGSFIFRIELQDVDGNPLYTTQLVEKILSPDQDQSDVVPPFNAYSAPGSPKVFLPIFDPTTYFS